MDSGPASKRPRYDAPHGNGNGHQNTRGPPVPYEDRANTAPSPVVHVRNLPDMAVEADVLEAASRFGTVKAIVMLPKKRQALVEFTDLEAAVRLVKNLSMQVRGADTQLNFSTSQKIHRAGGSADEPPKEHNVLLLSINNTIYPIDVEVIHKITSPHGNVLRIVVFRKLGIQAMVEFDTVQAAVTAKSFLNGADIYSGCCTLKIEFAKPETLTIIRNDKESWDYTRDLPGPDPNPHRAPPLLDRPHESAPFPGGNYGGSHYPEHRQGFVDRPSPYDRPYTGERRSPPPPGFGPGPSSSSTFERNREFDRPRESHYDVYGSRQEPRDPYGPPPSGPGREPERYDRRYDGSSYDSSHHSQNSYGGGGGTVAMLYGLDPDKMNCDRLFNLFCLYGNVARIKFLKSKEGSAMIQMTDAMAMQRAIEQLNGIYIFEKKIQVAASRQVNLNDVPNPYPLADGTPSFKDYTDSRNNRFTTLEMASKNRITPPTRCLHFFNAPAGSEPDEVLEVFTRNGSEKPQITIIQGKSDRSTSGFVEWETMEAAVEALILANHTELPNKSKTGHPYMFKVCFTQPGRPSQGPPGSRRP